MKTPVDGSKKPDAARRRRRRRILLTRLGKEAWQEAPFLSVGAVAMLGSSLCNQALPRLIGRLIERNNSTNNRPQSSSYVTVGWVVLGGGLASFLRTSVLGSAQERIAARLRQQAFGSLLTRELEWFQSTNPASDGDEKNVSDDSSVDNGDSTNDKKHRAKGLSPGAIGGILQEDVSLMASALSTCFANMLRSCSAICFSTYHMLCLHPTLTGVSLTLVPAVGIVAMVCRKAIKQALRQQQAAQQAAALFVEERLNHLQLVHMANRQEDEYSAYQGLMQRVLALSRKASVYQGLFMGSLFVGSATALLCVVHVGSHTPWTASSSSNSSSSPLSTFCTYSFLLGLGTSGLVKAVAECWQGIHAAERYYHLVSTPNGDSDDEETSATSKQDAKAANETKMEVDVSSIQSLSLEDVAFTYQSTGTQVLSSLSLTLERGKTVALCGKNGSGKSTCASLLAGLVQPTAGHVLLSNGTHLQNVPPMSRTRLVQIIPQSAALLHTTILENVRYNCPEASEQDVWTVLESIGCREMVDRLGGLDYHVGLNGCKLSGGERQRLALARALLCDPAMLIMDEPVTAMDAQGASAVQDAIQACSQQGRGLLLISHQAKSLAFVDKVMVLQDGTIVEEGSFPELKRKGPASALCQLMPEILLHGQPMAGQ